MTTFFNALVRQFPSLRLPWLALLDFAGLGLTLLLVLMQVGERTSTPEGRVFVLLLAAFGLNARFFLGQLKSLTTLLNKYRLLTLAAPLLAAVSTLVVQALSRSYYSGRALVIYTVFWSVWLVLARLAYKQFAPPLRVLLIEPASFTQDFERIPKVELGHFSSPPQSFKGWDVAVIDPSVTYSKEWLQWFAHADMYGVRTLSAPTVLETLLMRIPVNMLHGLWAFEILAKRSQYAFWKRFFDLATVILGAPIILLVSAIVAIVVYFDSGAPVLFWQQRVGKNGEPFMLVKFRTMRTDSEKTGAAFASQGDPRVTKTGAFLRKFRLDEIPQFWNVLRGEMSVIGPRPEQLGFAETFKEEIPLYDLRHNVEPGITGWAQVMQGYAADTDETREKLCFDFYYVKHYSFGLDIRVVYKTILTVLTGFGAR